MRSIRGVELEVTVPVDRVDLDLALLALPGHAEPHRDPGVAVPPQSAIEIGEFVNRSPVDRSHPIAVADARLVARAVQRDAADDELAVQLPQIDTEPGTRWRRGPAERQQITHDRLQRSIGTNIFPGRSALASLTTSEPIPASLPSGPSKAAPLQAGCGGAVKIASSRRYSQYPTKSRRDTTTAGSTASGPPEAATTTGVFSVSAVAVPIGIGLTANGSAARNRPSPEAMSKPTTPLLP